jgi:hypothetical protein
MNTVQQFAEDTFDNAIARSTGSPLSSRSWRHEWPLERVLFALAGTMTLLSVALARIVSPWFLLLTAFVGVSQWLYVVVGGCPASIVLRRVCGLRSAIYADPDPGQARSGVTV